MKGHVTGPISFGLTVTDENKRSALYNEGLVDSIVKCCSMKAAWQISRLKKYNNNIIIDSGIIDAIIQGILRPYLVFVRSDKYPKRGSLKAFQTDHIIKPIAMRTLFLITIV